MSYEGWVAEGAKCIARAATLDRALEDLLKTEVDQLDKLERKRSAARAADDIRSQRALEAIGRARSLIAAASARESAPAVTE